MLKGLNAIVTGSTSGIGLGIANVLASKGANLVITGFGDADAIEKERAGLAEKYGVEVVYSNADMSKPDDVRAMVELCVEKLGSVDILVNNAGIQHTASVEEFPEEKWHQVIAINLSGIFFAIQAALPHMKKKGFGRIINIGSVHGLIASKHKAAYVAAKHGVVGLMRTFAVELGAQNIRVNSVHPTNVNTPLFMNEPTMKLFRPDLENPGPEDMKVVGQLMHTLPIGWVEPEDIANAVLFLASDEARFITGVTLPVDGGSCLK